MNIRFTISEGNSRPFHSLLKVSLCANTRIPLPDYGKTFYLYDEKSQRLTACKVLKVVIGCTNHYVRPFLWLETPNGKREIEYYSAILLESKEDFLRYMQGQKGQYRFETKTIRELFPDELTHLYSGLSLCPSAKRCWVFRDGRAEKAPVTMRFLTFDKQGCEVCFLPTSDNRKVYLSQNDCLNDNVVSIVDFDEEDATTSWIMDASNNHDPDLVERVNSAYNEKPEEFAKIVDLLAQRDIDERPNPEFYAKGVWDRCHEYCQNIADNSDLRTILSYCRL